MVGRDCVACGGYHFSDEGISLCKFLHWLGGHYEATKEEIEEWDARLREAQERKRRVIREEKKGAEK